MPRLSISLPDDLRRDNHGREGQSQGDQSSRRLGAGIGGADEHSRRFVRWFDCWANSDD